MNADTDAQEARRRAFRQRAKEKAYSLPGVRDIVENARPTVDGVEIVKPFNQVDVLVLTGDDGVIDVAFDSELLASRGHLRYNDAVVVKLTATR